MNIFKNFFSKKPKEDNRTEETYVDILISLNKNFEIDLSLFLDTDYRKHKLDLVDYILVCSRFLNFDSNRLKKQMISILDSQIKNEENQLFIDSLITVLKNDIGLSDNNELNNFYIKPSQVFIKHIHEHQ